MALTPGGDALFNFGYGPCQIICHFLMTDVVFFEFSQIGMGPLIREMAMSNLTNLFPLSAKPRDFSKISNHLGSLSWLRCSDLSFIQFPLSRTCIVEKKKAPSAGKRWTIASQMM
jgi:hypothetical protein